MHGMYEKLPNLVLGFHGCERAVRDAVVAGEAHLRPSTNDYDWLGGGVYFWEQNHDRAMRWAEEHASEPAVIGAVVDLGNCLNLTDSYHIRLVQDEYAYLRDDLSRLGVALPTNTLTSDLLLRRLDCAVIEHLHERIRKSIASGGATIPPFDSARGLFSEGEPVYENAGFRENTHVQICVRNPNCIKGCFIPMEPDERWSMP